MKQPTSSIRKKLILRLPSMRKQNQILIDGNHDKFTPSMRIYHYAGSNPALKNSHWWSKLEFRSSMRIFNHENSRKWCYFPPKSYQKNSSPNPTNFPPNPNKKKSSQNPISKNSHWFFSIFTIYSVNKKNSFCQWEKTRINWSFYQ